MIEIAIFYLLGGSSVGYGLLRMGFPQIQLSSDLNKLIFGFIVAAIIFGVGIMAVLMTGDETLFFAMSGITALIIFAVMGAKRLAFDEKDIEIPETKVVKKKVYVEDRPIKDTSQKRITFEQGLMVKGKNFDIEKAKKQVFKEKEANILGTLQAKTRALEDETTQKTKNEALAKLREFAKQITATKKVEDIKKKKPVDDDEVEEELLSNLGDEETQFGEEEY